MTQQDIKKQIDENNRKIEALFNPMTFLFNTEIFELLTKNQELRKQCAHEYENGMCIYCYSKEEE